MASIFIHVGDRISQVSWVPGCGATYCIGISYCASKQTSQPLTFNFGQAAQSQSMAKRKKGKPHLNTLYLEKPGNWPKLI